MTYDQALLALEKIHRETPLDRPEGSRTISVTLAWEVGIALQREVERLQYSLRRVADRAEYWSPEDVRANVADALGVKVKELGETKKMTPTQRASYICLEHNLVVINEVGHVSSPSRACHLIAAAIQDAVDAERERCASLAESRYFDDGGVRGRAGRLIVAEIRRVT